MEAISSACRTASPDPHLRPRVGQRCRNAPRQPWTDLHQLPRADPAAEQAWHRSPIDRPADLALGPILDITQAPLRQPLACQVGRDRAWAVAILVVLTDPAPVSQTSGGKARTAKMRCWLLLRVAGQRSTRAEYPRPPDCLHLLHCRRAQAADFDNHGLQVRGRVTRSPRWPKKKTALGR